VTVLLIRVAEIPRAIKLSTWSFIKAINGDTTTVTPFIKTAGNW
jgi:hypothetical protein